jgi:polyhydroxyalkanoate synthesis regulator phasin
MPISAKRKLVAGATGLVVLAGTGGAYAAGQSNSTAPPKPPDRAAEQKAFLDDVAKRLNVTREQLDAALKGAAEARIDAAVAAGRLTKEQGAAAKQRLQNGLPLLGHGPLPGGRGFHGGFRELDGAADYLGLTEAQLREQLRSGKSLADVAKAQNKSVDGLKAALKSEIAKKLDEAVKDGRLTQDQKSRMLADIDQRLEALVNHTPPAGGPPRGFRRWR